VRYLRARPEVEDALVGLIGQADDGPPAMMAAATSQEPVPLVLLAPPGFPGRQVFRLEQLGAAEREGASGQTLVQLDRFVDQIADVVLREPTPELRAYRLQSVILSSPVSLPYSAAFPNDERQVHFFASPLWHDRMDFDPERALARIASPVLVLIGTEDPNTPMEAYLAGVRRGLAASGSSDAIACRIEGRVRHSFTPATVETVVDWLEGRVRGGVRDAGADRSDLAACLPDPPAGLPTEFAGATRAPTVL
jgi:pimeloyl-ACP methyl ester carboxylesterase